MVGCCCGVSSDVSDFASANVKYFCRSIYVGYHHLALACTDIQAIHRFYEGVMGFQLVKVEIGPVPEGGWGKHFFYRMEDDSKFIAFWELHDVPGVGEIETNISKAAGLPDQINHISFDVNDAAELESRKQRWLDAGLEVVEVDHNWCHSIYAKDPNDTLVEFCLTTGSFDANDRARALAALTSDALTFSAPPAAVNFYPPPA
jgi:catechol 2,3-dioxygenase-like lactoylglutathione lyase family enzyme